MTMLAPQPRCRQPAQTLINEIESGRYPVGDLPPTEFKPRRKPLYSPQGA
jgi:DNA-binding GntR family transcriptional regulator